jgi:hypothetical protein
MTLGDLMKDQLSKMIRAPKKATKKKEKTDD